MKKNVSLNSVDFDLSIEFDDLNILAKEHDSKVLKEFFNSVKSSVNNDFYDALHRPNRYFDEMDKYPIHDSHSIHGHYRFLEFHVYRNYIVFRDRRLSNII